MGLFDSVLKKKPSINEELKLRAEQDKEQHQKKYENVINIQRNNYLNKKEKALIDYVFVQIMLGSTYLERDFSLLGVLPEEYRCGEYFLSKIMDVKNEYFKTICEDYKEGKASLSFAVKMLEEIKNIPELNEEINELLEIKKIFPNALDAADSVFTLCDNVEDKMQEAKDLSPEDAFELLETFTDAFSAMDEGDYSRAVKKFLFVGKEKQSLDNLKLAIIQNALNDEQHEIHIQFYSALNKMAKRAFGILDVIESNGEVEIVLHPSVDMVIAEVIRYSKTGAIDKYNHILEEWLIKCADCINNSQFTVLQNVFSYLKAFRLEEILLEFLVKNNLPYTGEQMQRLSFLKQNISNIGTINYSTKQVIGNENQFLYDHKFLNWNSNDIQQYFNRLTLEHQTQKTPMVIDEWEKDVNISGISWNINSIYDSIKSAIENNFAQDYDVSIVEAGAAVDNWIDTIPTIRISACEKNIKNSDIEFLLYGEQMTRTQLHLSIMTLLSNDNMENALLCQKVVTIKEKHNPRLETFINTVKSIIIKEIDAWINKMSNIQDIY